MQMGQGLSVDILKQGICASMTEAALWHFVWGYYYYSTAMDSTSSSNKRIDLLVCTVRMSPLFCVTWAVEVQEVVERQVKIR
jgi:hypothetical protein